ncbi:MAG TPA: CHAP domain-containing protein [Candidatus Saccharimonadales bacterium]|nr:CHAP domain-containing protein [Candidatus Saccharimonadales bacterium]
MMKIRMRTQTNITILGNLRKAASGTLLALLLAIYPATSTLADNFDDQINALQSQVSAFQEQAGQLRAQADNLQAQIGAIDTQKRAIEAQISANEIKKEQLNQKIQETSDRIVKQKDGLGKNLRSMYVESDISPLEMVASSKSISDFIDKQEYRNKIRDAIQESLKEIKDLQAKLTAQRQEVENVLASQKALQSNLAEQEAQKNQLLAETQGQEDAYRQLVSSNNSKITDLRAQQRAANARFIGSAGSGPACGGGYPGMYCNAPMDSIVDNWLMYNRECVSYAAWKVYVTHGYSPTGWGNANMWPGNARSAGLSVDSNPRVGDVAVWNVGYYGHVMFVEAVHGDGTISISQYNADWNGTYSTARISSGGLEYIHFK